MITPAPPRHPAGHGTPPQWKTKGPDLRSPGLSSFLRARLPIKLLICQDVGGCHVSYTEGSSCGGLISPKLPAARSSDNGHPSRR